jgi:DDE superfamily endonuclease
MLDGVFCVGDGLKLPIQCPNDVLIQNRFYNGWAKGHYISNLLIFGIDGKIIHCVLNAPGSVHDSTLAEWGGFYESMQSIYLEYGGKFVWIVPLPHMIIHLLSNRLIVFILEMASGTS